MRRKKKNSNTSLSLSLSLSIEKSYSGLLKTKCNFVYAHHLNYGISSFSNNNYFFIIM